MSVNYTSKRSGTPDQTAGHQLATQPSQENSNIFFPAGVSAQNSIGTKPSAHRSSLVGIDTATDMSSAGFGTSPYDINNDIHLIAWGECNVSSGSISVVPVYYDTAGIPMFFGPLVTLPAKPQRVSSSGNFMTDFQRFLPPGADKVKLFVTEISGWWSLFLSSV